MTAIDPSSETRQSLMGPSDPIVAHSRYSSQHTSMSCGPGPGGAEIADDSGLGRAVARRTLGICLLLFVVVLWTASNFLASVCISQLTFVVSLGLSFFSPSGVTELDQLIICCHDKSRLSSPTTHTRNHSS